MPNKKPKYCLITGATGGIGRAMVKAFNDSGYRVIATDRIPQPENLVCAHYLETDLGRFTQDETYASEFTTSIRNMLDGNGLHALVNNAAVQILGGIDDLTREDWRLTLEVNLLAPFLLIQALLPEIEVAKGSVVNIGSIHAHLTKKNFVAYATSKAAFEGMTRALAVDVGPRIRINVIEPGAIATDMLAAGFEGNLLGFQALSNCNPQQRIGQPEEVACLALALIGDDLKFLHGASIGINGGIGGRLFDPD